MGALDFLMNEINTSKKKKQRNKKREIVRDLRRWKRLYWKKFDPLKE